MKNSRTSMASRLFSPRTSLPALGVDQRSLKLFEVIAGHVEIKHKATRHIAARPKHISQRDGAAGGRVGDRLLGAAVASGAGGSVDHAEGRVGMCWLLGIGRIR